MTWMAAIATAALLAASAGAGTTPDRWPPPVPGNLQACVVVGGGQCEFVCQANGPAFVGGAGPPGSAFTFHCGGLTFSCTGPACIADATGRVQQSGRGTCTSTGAVGFCWAYP